QSLADPSINPDEIDEETPIGDFKIGGLNHGAVKDVQQGTRKMLQHIVLPGSEEGTFGFLSTATPALANIMQFESLDLIMSDTGVFESLGVATKGVSAGEAIGKVAFAAGMAALSATGPIGAAAAAIVGFGAAIIRAFKSRAIREAENEKQRIQEAYKYFPPLQEPRAEVDTWSVNSMILPVLQTGDWTSIFLPRFKSDKWVVQNRIGGFAMAPGEELKSENALGEAETVFNPSGGVGYLPGANRIKSVVQVGLDLRDPRMAKWINGKKFPLNTGMVRDVGDFLVNTTRLAAVAWSWVATHENSPHLYKVDVGELHRRWENYCLSGIERMTSRIPGTPPRNPKDLVASAINCSIGGWRCNYREGQYHVYGKGGHLPDEMNNKVPGIFDPNYNRDLGCLIDSHTSQIRGKCLTTIYELRSRAIFDQLAARQHDQLGRTLLCAYVRKSWAAFRDPNLAIRLDKMRGLLLEHPDRMHVKLADVPPEEKFQGESLRERLIKSGVGKKRFDRLAANPVGLERPKGDAPTVDPGDVAMPFDIGTFPVATPTPPWWQDRKIWTAVGLTIAGAGASFAWGRYGRR
ncbi:MAG: hypothetical protein ACPG4T_12130, partial [Nannocystaceae bacterium]